MIEVFKTNIQDISQADKLITLLLDHFPGSRVNVDLHDCDKVLRIEGRNFLPSTVMRLVEQNSFMCAMLE